MSETQNTKYDLEDRTKLFAKNTRAFIKNLTTTIANNEDAKQLIRSTGSVGANYIEANESLSKKDFIMRIKICRKEAKESAYWLDLLDINKDNRLDINRKTLFIEASELTKIFGAILEKCK